MRQWAESEGERWGQQASLNSFTRTTASNQRTAGRNVLHGDPSDADFWDRMQSTHSLELVMLALPKHATNMAVLEQLKLSSFAGRVAATAKFQDETAALKEAGAHTVFNLYAEAGAGFAIHVVSQGKDI